MSRSDIDHYEGLEVWGPVTHEQLWALLEPLDLPRGLRVLDVGCGRAALLITLAERLGAQITGADHSAAALAHAQRDLEARIPGAAATWVQCGMNELSFEEGSFDLVMAIGGPYRNDNLEETLQVYASWLAEDGTLLYGDGFWALPPPAPYLAATGLGPEELLDRTGYLSLAERVGFSSADHLIAPKDTWDHFEDTVLRNHEAYAARFEEDLDVQKMIGHKRAWNRAQARWGRDTMGFSVDVFRRAP